MRFNTNLRLALCIFHIYSNTIFMQQIIYILTLVEDNRRSLTESVSFMQRSESESLIPCLFPSCTIRQKKIEFFLPDTIKNYVTWVICSVVVSNLAIGLQHTGRVSNNVGLECVSNGFIYLVSKEPQIRANTPFSFGLGTSGPKT